VKHTCKAVRPGAKLFLVLQLSIKSQQRLVDGVHDSIYMSRAAREVPAAAQRDLLCTLPCPVSTLTFCQGSYRSVSIHFSSLIFLRFTCKRACPELSGE